MQFDSFLIFIFPERPWQSTLFQVFSCCYWFLEWNSAPTAARKRLTNRLTFNEHVLRHIFNNQIFLYVQWWTNASLNKLFLGVHIFSKQIFLYVQWWTSAFLNKLFLDVHLFKKQNSFTFNDEQTLSSTSSFRTFTYSISKFSFTFNDEQVLPWTSSSWTFTEQPPAWRSSPGSQRQAGAPPTDQHEDQEGEGRRPAGRVGGSLQGQVAGGRAQKARRLPQVLRGKSCLPV